MKSLSAYVCIILCVLVLASCRETIIVKSTPHSKSAPPGQVKKATGSKSAKQYAPGQAKKNK